MALRATPSEGCHQLTWHHFGDGWRLTGKDKDDHGVERTVDLRLVVVPAVTTANAEAFVPIYVVELSPHETDPHSTPRDERMYAGLAPIGAMPAHEAFSPASTALRFCAKARLKASLGNAMPTAALRLASRQTKGLCAKPPGAR